jgi:hypothetical protein
MKKGLICLAGAGVLALVAAAPTATLARPDRDWGVSVGPSGVYVGPQRDYRYKRYRYDRYSYRPGYDDDYWRYRYHRRYYD